jgi:methylase of polypeptide subunit release factors
MRLLDVGAGSGAGGLFAAKLLRELSPRIVLTDINDGALRMTRINADINRVPNVEVCKSDLYAGIDGVFDLIISNPPYLVDASARVYRHGGGEFGSDLSARILEQGLPHLASGGAIVLYTGSAIVDGIDLFERTLRKRLKNADIDLLYEEIDPDVFGEELDAAPYDRADRIAVVTVIAEKL